MFTWAPASRSQKRTINQSSQGGFSLPPPSLASSYIPRCLGHQRGIRQNPRQPVRVGMPVNRRGGRIGPARPHTRTHPPNRTKVRCKGGKYWVCRGLSGLSSAAMTGEHRARSGRWHAGGRTFDSGVMKRISLSSPRNLPTMSSNAPEAFSPSMAITGCSRKSGQRGRGRCEARALGCRVAARACICAAGAAFFLFFFSGRPRSAPARGWWP